MSTNNTIAGASRLGLKKNHVKDCMFTKIQSTAKIYFRTRQEPGEVSETGAKATAKTLLLRQSFDCFDMTIPFTHKTSERRRYLQRTRLSIKM
jgi:hypothetical protein